MWVLIATSITAIVNVWVWGTGTASWLIAPTEGIPTFIHMDDGGISVVALLGLHTYQQLHQLGLFSQALFRIQYMSGKRPFSNTDWRNIASYMDAFMVEGESTCKLK